MRAAVLEGPGRVGLTEVDDPQPGPGEVCVRLRGAGICASELPLFEGREWFDYPRAAGEPGHEGWGVVAALGPGVDEVEVGQRVAAISYRAHAEYDVTAAANVVALPPGDDPFPGEPLACAVNVMRRADVCAGDRVAVVGCGFLGLLLVALCARVAGEVTAIGRRSSTLDLALAMGATRAVRADEGGDAAFDVVIEATGAQGPLDLAGRLTRTRGRLVIAGFHQDGRRSIDLQLWNWRGLDVINAHERDQQIYVRGLREAVQAVAEGWLDPAPLLTHRFTLDELQEAYRVSVQRPEGFVKAVWCDG